MHASLSYAIQDLLESDRTCLIMIVRANFPRIVLFRLAQLHKALLSITSVADAGFECHLNSCGGCVFDSLSVQRRAAVLLTGVLLTAQDGESLCLNNAVPPTGLAPDTT